MTYRTAVILFNLGGPDTQESVRPFLFNLFNDKAIIGAPNPIRWLLAQLISRKRAPLARDIYQHMGGGSPLLEQTEEQAQALEAALADEEQDVKVFSCMRYWHPMTEEVVSEVKEYDPDHVVLLPLYPQFSTTTTGSSFDKWDKEAAKQKLNVPTARVCCYPTDVSFLAAHADTIRMTYFNAAKGKQPRLLFSAHGLPKKIIDAGDPYQWQIEQTVESMLPFLNIPELDYQISYQSRVGPLEWIGPSTDDEIERAGKEGVPLVVVPIAFVSEHSETLVELDIEYAELAEEHGVPAYHRVPALRTHPEYITMLAGRCREAMATTGLIRGLESGCPAHCNISGCRKAA